MPVRATFDVDKESAKAIRRALEEVSLKLRGEALYKTLKKEAETLVEATRLEAVKLSPDYARAIKAYKGKYSRKMTPYVVIHAANKTVSRVRSYRTFSHPYKTNWRKIEHFIVQGTAAGTRSAGRSVRQARSGRKKNRKSVDAFGRPRMIDRPTRGKNFVVEGKGGRVFPIKQIKHPGSKPFPSYDAAMNSGKKDRAIRSFQKKIIEQLGQVKRKHGIK